MIGGIMEFLKRLIETNQTIKEQPLTESEELIRVDGYVENVGNFQIFAVSISVDDKDVRYHDYDATIGSNETAYGGKLTEVVVGITNKDTNVAYRAVAVPNNELDTDDVDADSVQDFEIYVQEAPNGPRAATIKSIEDEELEEFLAQLTRTYLVKNIEHIVRDSLYHEYDPVEDRRRR